MHALQVEINRTLYMDEARIERLPGFALVQERMTALVIAMAEAAPLLQLA